MATYDSQRPVSAAVPGYSKKKRAAIRGRGCMLLFGASLPIKL